MKLLLVMYFSKNKTEEAIEVLRRISAINDKEFDILLRNEQEGAEK